MPILPESGIWFLQTSIAANSTKSLPGSDLKLLQGVLGSSDCQWNWVFLAVLRSCSHRTAWYYLKGALSSSNYQRYRVPFGAASHHLQGTCFLQLSEDCQIAAARDGWQRWRQWGVLALPPEGSGWGTLPPASPSTPLPIRIQVRWGRKGWAITLQGQTSIPNEENAKKKSYHFLQPADQVEVIPWKAGKHAAPSFLPSLCCRKRRRVE